ncbi:glucose 1-dehydrogenase [Candidatus Bathyarchaeota archaeon]|nr:glucose 1-dehydrogenase [Candidatus Bathyarchaeota archaeon]
MPGKLEGRVALITGGASGIGEATTRLFIEEGAKVLVTDIQDERGQALADALGPNADYLHADVSIEDDVEQAVRHTTETFGRLDVMFNNAGIAGAVGSIEEVSAEAFDETIDVLLKGVFLGIKHATAVMKAQRGGSIINTASIAGIRTGYGNHIYSAAKAGVIQLTRSTAMELGESGVRVNCICPGFIATPMIGRARGLSVEEADEKLDIVKDSFEGAQPIRRTGIPEDIAKAAMWLASDDSSFVNGHALVVDGGVTGGRMWSDYQDAIDGLKRALGQE